MFNLDELKFIQKVLKDSESQDEITMEIIDKIDNALEKVKESDKVCLWKFRWDCGRQGDVMGVFKATKEEVKNAIGKEVYFGEILGKHSEICGILEEGEVELISAYSNYVMNATEHGYNPLEYIED